MFFKRKPTPPHSGESLSTLEAAAHDLINQSHAVSEQVRLRVIHSLKILNTAPELVYDDVVAVAKRLCGTTSATLTFIGEHDAFIKASTTGECGNVPREHSFCNITIETPQEMMIVPDARIDPRFQSNPFVLDHSVCFYAGVPMVTDQGVPLGALCVVDEYPRRITDEEMTALKSLSRIVTNLAMMKANI